MIHIWHGYMWSRPLRYAKRRLRRLLHAKLVVVVHELLLGVIVVQTVVLPRTVFEVFNVSLLVVF